MKKEYLSLEELKNIGLRGLCFFDSVCRKYGLRYYLAYGTLLGAVRHCGFIPWDDDIDLWMPRSDYDKLIYIYKEEPICWTEWELNSYEINEKYCFPWAKLCNKDTVVFPSRFNNGFVYGVSIDIFPLDGYDGDNFEDANNYMMHIRANYSSSYSRIKPFSGGIEGIKNPIIKYGKRIYNTAAENICGSHVRILDQLDSQLRKCSLDMSHYCGAPLAPVTSIFESRFFNESLQLSFEAKVFPAPANYDEILTRFYGDYMTPPPVEKQVTHHSFVAYQK